MDQRPTSPTRSLAASLTGRAANDAAEWDAVRWSDDDEDDGPAVDAMAELGRLRATVARLQSETTRLCDERDAALQLGRAAQEATTAADAILAAMREQLDEHRAQLRAHGEARQTLEAINAMLRAEVTELREASGDKDALLAVTAERDQLRDEVDRLREVVVEQERARDELQRASDEREQLRDQLRDQLREVSNERDQLRDQLREASSGRDERREQLLVQLEHAQAEMAQQRERAQTEMAQQRERAQAELAQQGERYEQLAAQLEAAQSDHETSAQLLRERLAASRSECDQLRHQLGVALAGVAELTARASEDDALRLMEEQREDLPSLAQSAEEMRQSQSMLASEIETSSRLQRENLELIELIERMRAEANEHEQALEDEAQLLREQLTARTRELHDATAQHRYELARLQQALDEAQRQRVAAQTEMQRLPPAPHQPARPSVDQCVQTDAVARDEAADKERLAVAVSVATDHIRTLHLKREQELLQQFMREKAVYQAEMRQLHAQDKQAALARLRQELVGPGDNGADVHAACRQEQLRIVTDYEAALLQVRQECVATLRRMKSEALRQSASPNGSPDRQASVRRRMFDDDDGQLAASDLRTSRTLLNGTSPPRRQAPAPAWSDVDGLSDSLPPSPYDSPTRRLH